MDDPTADLRRFLDASPSPWHVVATTAERLTAAGFAELAETDSWRDRPTAGFVRRDGALIAWRGDDGPVRIVGAHTDSPGLRIAPRPDIRRVSAWAQLAVEIYGGVLLNSWLDRDLGVAGRIVDREGATHLVRVDEPIARVPQLAIHLDREIGERGLLLDRHQHTLPVWGTDSDRTFEEWLAERGDVDAATWDLCLYDVQPAAVLGADRSLLAAGRLDNQLSCWAAMTALIAAESPPRTAVMALFDHEEVGSDSTVGAGGPFLEHVLERLGPDDRDERHRARAASSCISADNAHAVHPNYPERHDVAHLPLVNHGPVLKVNANQRYATSAPTAAHFRRICEDAGVPVQVFVSRNNMPCGSTIGPITATRLGIPTVDVGVPQLSMHSARELCGTVDPGHLVTALTAYFAAPVS